MLIVEDQADTARILGSVVTDIGYIVNTTGSVASALSTAASGSFDVLVSDLGLPDGSGIDLVRELRHRGCAIPAIALSGYGQPEDVRRCLEAGFAIHLEKPTSPQALLDAIEKVIRGN